MIHVCDNFFNDPYNARNIALKAEYHSLKDEFLANSSSWPGFRSYHVSDFLTDKMVSEVKYYTKNQSLTLESISFQYITGDYGEGWVHTDSSALYTCMVYLAVDSPSYSGTEVCDYCSEFKDAGGKARRDFYNDNRNFLKRYNYDSMTRRHNSRFDPIATIAHRFNRFVLFESRLYHRAQKYFGTCMENSRLSLIAFLK